ncbi:peptidoglycan DD-metalloendopeptidase family protein [Albirhodobacter sp. R86504]|uniref:peptidoglycan DD-metalloendopeptidase family protein n=1 Tax=Albirhodobacter sp. R86504 TaxID=3093848 RepID=UPI0036723836
MTPTRFPRPQPSRRAVKFAALGLTALALAGCSDGGVDLDLRKFSKIGFDTSSAAQNAASKRPEPDARGVITYPTYQVAVARSGETVGAIAQRLGIAPATLAAKNALDVNTPLAKGEILVLPTNVGGGTMPIAGGVAGSSAIATESIDITTLAGNAINRAEGGAATPIAAAPTGNEPVQHPVARGETAYSIARYYNVNVKTIADYNGLPQDLSVREGQILLIPLAARNTDAIASANVPGSASVTPTPPSAATPLPDEKTISAATPVATPPAPDLGASVSKATTAARMQMPVSGSIIRPYVKSKNDGIDIAASAGTAVQAAEAGTVAAITKDTEQVPILVLRHSDGLLTVYANIDGITVAKGASVTKGQTIAKARASDPGFVHFEVRKGFESVDPMPYLQ